MTITARFEVEFTRFIDADGDPVAELPAFASDRDRMLEFYRWMVLTRTFDAKAVALQRTGRLGTYASSLGQEAVNVGVALAMNDDDILLPSFREHGAQLVRGVHMKELFMYWGGDERGSDFAGPRQDFPVSIPVGSHAAHGAGVALAFKLRGEPRVAVVTLGDGATSKGDVYEAMNVAGAWRLPVIFLVINNQWAISVPRAKQTAAETLAQKAIAAGFDGHQVDGNDVVAVYQAAVRALDRARAGGGATLLEAMTYRLADHTTVDNASRYREDAEVSRHWKEEPIARMRQFLAQRHDWTKDDEEALLETCNEEVERAAESYLSEPPGPATSMFDYLYDTLPRTLKSQRAAVDDS
jgi:2-oxoisovalerate dehydrogenase E1 component alpha subunit